MAYTVTWSDDYVLVSLSADVDAEQLMTMADELVSHYRFDDIRKRVYDCSGVTMSSLTAHDLKIYSHVDNAAYLTNPNAHIVFVNSDDEVTRSMYSYGGRFIHKGWLLTVCDNLEEALAWQPSLAQKDKISSERLRLLPDQPAARRPTMGRFS